MCGLQCMLQLGSYKESSHLNLTQEISTLADMEFAVPKVLASVSEILVLFSKEPAARVSNTLAHPFCLGGPDVGSSPGAKGMQTL